MGNADMDGLGDDTSYQWLGGYNFGSVASMPFSLALEGYYENFGRAAPGFKGHAFGMDLVAPIELAPRVSLLGRLGWAQGKLTTPQTSGTESDLKMGFGLQYQLNKQLGIRGELSFYKFDPSVDVMSIGLVLGL